MPRKNTDPVKIRPKSKNGQIYGYEARYKVHGEPSSRSIFGKTEAECRAKLNKLVAESKAVTTTMLLRDYISTWVAREETKARTGDIAFQTYKTYEGALRRWVVGGLGHIELRAFMPPQGRKIVDDHFTNLEIKHKGARKIQQAAQVLRIVFNDAVSEGLLTASPMMNLGNRNSVIPNHTAEEKTILTVDQCRRLLEMARHESYDLYTLVLFTLATGLRQGEILGLEISAIDFINGDVDIYQQATRSMDPDGKSGTRIKELKDKERRRISVPSDVLDVMRSYTTGKTGFIWPTSVGTPQSGSTFMARQFRPILEALRDEPEGFPDIDFHALRHTHTSILISAGVNIKTISERLGHSSIQLTLDTYGHLLPDDDRRAADAIVGFAKTTVLRAVK